MVYTTYLWWFGGWFIIVLATLLWYIVVKLGIWGNNHSWDRSGLMSGDQQSGHALGCPTAALSIGHVLFWKIIHQKIGETMRNRNLLTSAKPKLLTSSLKWFFKLASMVCMKLLPQHAPALFPMCWLYPFEFGASLPRFQILEGIMLLGVSLFW